MLKFLKKEFLLWLTGGAIYVLIELAWRGYSHWSMFILGGMCFILIGLLNELWSWDTPIWKQMLSGTVIVTILEFITGCVVNLLWNMNVWDYSNLPFNILGQVCLLFSVLWFFLSAVAIMLDDYLRWKWFDEEHPRYRLISGGEVFYPFGNGQKFCK